MTPNYAEQARRLVCDTINAELGPYEWIELEDVFVVWFCKTLKNWKALVSTTWKRSAYYEVTHNGDTGETYIDIYTKERQIVATPAPGGDTK